jgi:hypothetical protein
MRQQNRRVPQKQVKKHIHLLQYTHFLPSKIIFFAVAGLLLLGISILALPFFRKNEALSEVPKVSGITTSVVTPTVTTVVQTATQEEVLIIASVTPKPTTNSSVKVISTSATVSPKPTIKPTAKPTAAPTVTAIPTSTPTMLPTPTPKPTIDFSKPWTVALNCPATTQNCVPCTSGTYCRYEAKYKNLHGFLGWSCQNNNPGNIRNASTNMATDSKNKMILRNGGTAACGVRYDSRGGSYFVFSTYNAGISGLKAYVKGINNGEHSSYALKRSDGTYVWKCGNCTLAQFFSKYAPGDSVYASKVATYIGSPVTTQTLLSYVVANKLDLFVEAIKNREGFFTK